MKKIKNKSLERINHMLNSIHEIQTIINEKDEETITSNLLTQHAIYYKFIVIGEAIMQVDSEILNRYPYPWHEVKGLRNFIAHEYHKISLPQIITIIQEDLPKLALHLNKIVANEFGPPQ
jgi:uncharacterized protein with HEPN domain